MNELLVCSAAEDEYADALAWYAERSIDVAELFDAEFDRAMMAIAADPNRFPRCNDRHRFYLMRNSPFQIIYRQQQEHWVVVAVAHTARKPRYWSKR